MVKEEDARWCATHQVLDFNLCGGGTEALVVVKVTVPEAGATHVQGSETLLGVTYPASLHHGLPTHVFMIESMVSSIWPTRWA